MKHQSSMCTITSVSWSCIAWTITTYLETLAIHNKFFGAIKRTRKNQQDKKRSWNNNQADHAIIMSSFAVHICMFYILCNLSIRSFEQMLAAVYIRPNHAPTTVSEYLHMIQIYMISYRYVSLWTNTICITPKYAVEMENTSLTYAE